MRFRHIYAMGPIDFWGGAQIASDEEAEQVLRQMPEGPGSEEVFKLYMPVPGRSSIEPVWLCKADNNGTVYMFSHVDIEPNEMVAWEVTEGFADE